MLTCDAIIVFDIFGNTELDSCVSHSWFLQSLLKLLVHGSAEGTHHTVLHCLLELTAHLRQRLALCQDTAMGVTDQLTIPGL